MLAALRPARVKARDVRRLADMRTLINALMTYYDSNGKFPCHSVQFSSASNFVQLLQDQGYISNIPRDPGPAPLRYEYVTLKDPRGLVTGPCGKYAFLGFYSEAPFVTCPTFGKSGPTTGVGPMANQHCHILLPQSLPPPCNPYGNFILSGLDPCQPWVDTTNDY